MILRMKGDIMVKKKEVEITEQDFEEDKELEKEEVEVESASPMIVCGFCGGALELIKTSHEGSEWKCKECARGISYM